MPGRTGRLRAVLFDYGNVLVGWDPRNLYRDLFADPAEMQAFLREVCASAWHLRHDEGAPMAETIPALIAEHPRYAAEIAAWDARFGDMLSGPVPGMPEIVEALAEAGVDLAILTNMPAEKAETCFAAFPRMDLFKGAVVSGKERATKPGARSYELALEVLGASAEETLFVDDLPANIAGAERVGLKGHLFTGAAQLREALAAAGLLR